MAVSPTAPPRATGITNCSISDLDGTSGQLIRLFLSVAPEADKALDLLALQPEVPQSIVIERPEMIDRTPRSEFGDNRANWSPKMGAQKGSPEAHGKRRRRAISKKSLSCHAYLAIGIAGYTPQ
jgi:hypothetical protein